MVGVLVYNPVREYLGDNLIDEKQGMQELSNN
jgi:hypothetical protein